MKAKEFLLQVNKLDKMIENKLIEVEQWKEIANNATGNMTGEKVQSSGNPHRIADAIARYIDLENEINQCINELIDTKKAVISVIEQLDAIDYDFLHKVYIQYIPLYEVAAIYGKSYSWATTKHKEATDKLQTLIDNGKVCV